MGLAGNIPGIGIVASLIDAGLYFGEGNMVMFGACLVDAALGFVPFGAGYLIKMGSKSVRLLNVVIKGSKLARNSIDFYRNTKNFAFSAADFYIRHEGTFFTNDFKWGLADVGDIMSMAMSGTGMLQSGAGIYKSVTDLSAFLYASGIKDDIKDALVRLKNGIKNTVHTPQTAIYNVGNKCGTGTVDNRLVENKFFDNGERIATTKQVRNYKKKMNSLGINVVVDKKGTVLYGNKVAGFDYSTGTIYIRKKPGVVDL